MEYMPDEAEHKVGHMPDFERYDVLLYLRAASAMSKSD